MNQNTFELRERLAQGAAGKTLRREQVLPFESSRAVMMASHNTSPRAVVHPAAATARWRNSLDEEALQRQNKNRKAKSRRRTWFEKQGLQFGDNELELEYMCKVGTRLHEWAVGPSRPPGRLNAVNQRGQLHCHGGTTAFTGCHPPFADFASDFPFIFCRAVSPFVVIM